MSGYNNLKSEGLRNQRNTVDLRAMVEPKRSVRKGAFECGLRVLYTSSMKRGSRERACVP